MAIDENSFVRRVLIYRLGSLGDTIVSLPSLHLVARAFPQAERRLLTNFPVETKAAAAQTILDGTGLIHDYFSYAVGLRHFNKLLDLRKAIREWQPDVVVYLMPGRGIRNARRDAVFFRSCGITRLIGMPLSLDKQRHRKRAANSLYESEAARLARCVAELGDARLDDPASWDMRLNVHENNAAEIALVPAGKRPIIACSLGTKVQAKDWGVDNWRMLIGRLAQIYPGYALVMMGAGSEFDASSYAADGWSSVSGAGPVINLCGQLQPRESAAVLQRAKIFLGHDSGPMHLAATVQTPTVSIFAARTKPGIWFPHGDQHAVIYHQVSCFNCGLDSCIARQRQCLTSISVNEVLEQVKRILPPTLHVISSTAVNGK